MSTVNKQDAGNTATSEPTYQERVALERESLDKKIEALEKFTRDVKFTKLPYIDQDHLTGQLFHMKAYSRILAYRIERFS